MGNPHCVVFCGCEGMDVEEIGRILKTHPYSPERVNTEFVKVINSNTLRMRVWERRMRQTTACGTGPALQSGGGFKRIVSRARISA